MMYSRKYSLWLSIVLLFTILFIVGCSGNEDGPSEAQLQETVDAAVQATTDALNAPTLAPTTAPSATPVTVEEAVEEVAVSEEESEPPTPTPLPTITNTPTPAATATPEAPFISTDQGDGTVLYQLPFEFFEITLPSEWIVADLTISADEFNQSEIKEILGSQLFQGLVASGVKFYAVNWSDASKTSISPANINIATQATAEGTTLEEFGTLTFDQLVYEFELLAEDIGQTEAIVSGLPATRLDYFWEIRTPTGETLNLQVVKYIVIANGVAHNIVITLPADLAPSLLPSAESAVQNMTFYTE